MRSRSKFLLLSMVAFIPVLLFHNACGPGFQAREDFFLNVSSQAPQDLSTVNKGQVLYQNNCTLCHGAIAGFVHKNATAQTIETAVLSKIPEMAFLRSSLKASDFEAIALAVKSGGGPVIAQCQNESEFSKSTLRRLNAREYLNSVRHLFEDAALTVVDYPQANVRSGFDTHQEAIRTFNEDIPKLLGLAESLMTQMKGKTTSLLNSCNPALTKTAAQVTCAKNLIQRLSKKAYKKVPTATELQPLNAMVDAGANVQEGLSNALSAMLLAPQFMFHLVDYTKNLQARVHTLDGFELAARMSYFVWSSLPDEELLALAESGQLLNNSTLSAQVRRMLKDPKAKDLPVVFAQQWLELPTVKDLTRSLQIYPEFSPSLREALIQETSLLFKNTFDKGLPVDELLTANYSFMNKTLADYYKIPFVGSTPSSFVQHSLAQTERRGILNHPSLMSITSSEGATSPVKRGVYVLERILCEHIPEPPPGTTTGFDEIDRSLPIKERFAIHRTNRTCAACHDKIDPIGFGFENFDPIGRFRQTYPDANQTPIDASGQMPDGYRVTRSIDLAPWFADGDRFEKCLNAKLSSFALGRTLNSGDSCAAQKNVAALFQNQRPASFEALIEGLILSDFFRKSQVQE